MKIPDAEVRTKSVPTAAALVCMGHEIQRVIRREQDVVLVFLPAARDALAQFTNAKMFVDALVFENEHGGA